MLELFQSKAHMRGGVVWVLQAGMKGPGLPLYLSWYKQLRVPRAKFFRKIQFPGTLGRSLDEKFAARAFLGQRITARLRPVFAT